MRLLFNPHVIAAVVLAGISSDGWPKAEGERASSKTPARLQRAIARGARRARKEDEMVGILTKNQDAAAGTFPRKAHRDPRALAAARKPTCKVNGVETEFVECTGNGAECKQKCLDACAGVDDCSCCVGGEDNYGNFREACNSFRGKVCPDGSCSGGTACHYAAIGYVVDGCQEYDACYQAGYYGDLGRVVSSCNADSACFNAAYDGGEIQEITSSCNAFYACFAAGERGEIQEITSSCNAESACESAAYIDGYIKGISSSCNAFQACDFAASDGGDIQGLSKSCNAIDACESAARAGIIPNKMERCCNSEAACAGLAEEGVQDPDPDLCRSKSAKRSKSANGSKSSSMKSRSKSSSMKSRSKSSSMKSRSKSSSMKSSSTKSGKSGAH